MSLLGLFKKNETPKEPEHKNEGSNQTTHKTIKPDRYYETGGYKFHFPVDDSEKTNGWTVAVNLSKNNVKVKVDDSEVIGNVYLWHEEGIVRGLRGDETIFEITNRSKAYEEIIPYIKRKAKNVTITKRTGDYGEYYRVSIKFEVVIDDQGSQYT